MKIKNASPKTLFGLMAAMIVAGVISNVATAPAVRKYNELKSKVKGA